MKTAVLMGGESEEREVSLMSGKNILAALCTSGIEAEAYDWMPSRMEDFLSKKYERVFIALHGGSGENGSVQALLTLAGIPFTGVRMRPAALCMDKVVSKAIVEKTSVLVPKCLTRTVQEVKALCGSEAGKEALCQIGRTLGYPLIVKPSRNGSSVGVTLAENAESLEAAALSACLSEDEIVMFEQYIEGYELTVAMLNGKALGVCQIIPKTKFYDYEAKYHRDDTEYLTPSSLGAEFDAELCRQAEIACRALDCGEGTVRIDFLADRELRAYFLEANTVPGMTSHSLVPKIANHAGISFGDLCCRILSTAK